MSFLKQLGESLDAQQIYDGMMGKYETRFKVEGREYAFLATSIGGTYDDNTQWYLEFENIKSHRISREDNNPKVVKAFSEAVKQWVDDKHPHCFYTYGSQIESLNSIIEGIKKKVKKYNVLDDTAEMKDEATGEIIEGNPVGLVKWTKMAEQEYVGTEERANAKLDKFEQPYEEPEDIKPNKKFMTYRVNDKLEKPEGSYGLSESKGIVKWKRVYKNVGKDSGGKEKTEFKETPDGKRPKGPGWEPVKIGDIKESIGSFSDYKKNKLNEEN